MSRPARDGGSGSPGVRDLAVGTFKAWIDDDAVHWGAAIAYYSMVSLAPLVVLAMSILGKVLGTGAAERRVLDQVEILAGPRGAELARTVIEGAARAELGSLGAVLTAVLLLFGATAVFVNLQGALNRIWSVRPRTGALRNMVRTRVAAFFMVLLLGGLMLVSVVVGTAVGWAGPLLAPLESILPMVRVADLLTSLLVLWIFVALVFQVLPDAKIAWRDVWVGGLVTAGLLVAGKHLLAVFLARNALASMYGAAGSIFLLLLWVYYSAQVFFLGAEFTQVWAEARGREIQPEGYATRLERRPPRGCGAPASRGKGEEGPGA